MRLPLSGRYVGWIKREICIEINFYTLFNEIYFIIQVKNIKKSSAIQSSFFVKQLYFLLENNGYGILFKKKCGLAY